LALMRTALRYFDEAVRRGSIRRAADQLHVASSAVNRQLLQLEEEMDVKLFERLPRGIRATAAGEVVLNYVRQWNREAISLNRELGALRGGVRGTIRIAASESFTDELLPRAMHELQLRFPQVDFSLISGDNHLITSQLLARDADVVLAFDVSTDVRAQVVTTIASPLGVIAPPDHPLTRLREITLQDCEPYPLIIPGADWLQHSGLNSPYSGRQSSCWGRREGGTSGHAQSFGSCGAWRRLSIAGEAAGRVACSLPRRRFRSALESISSLEPGRPLDRATTPW
jgi:DNA-binding transcriptional LysR family regulator